MLWVFVSFFFAFIASVNNFALFNVEMNLAFRMSVSDLCTTMTLSCIWICFDFHLVQHCAFLLKLWNQNWSGVETNGNNNKKKRIAQWSRSRIILHRKNCIYNLINSIIIENKKKHKSFRSVYVLDGTGTKNLSISILINTKYIVCDCSYRNFIWSYAHLEIPSTKTKL